MPAVFEKRRLGVGGDAFAGTGAKVEFIDSAFEARRYRFVVALLCGTVLSAMLSGPAFAGGGSTSGTGGAIGGADAAAGPGSDGGNAGRYVGGAGGGAGQTGGNGGSTGEVVPGVAGGTGGTLPGQAGGVGQTDPSSSSGGGSGGGGGAHGYFGGALPGTAATGGAGGAGGAGMSSGDGGGGGAGGWGAAIVTSPGDLGALTTGVTGGAGGTGGNSPLYIGGGGGSGGNGLYLESSGSVSVRVQGSVSGGNGGAGGDGGILTSVPTPRGGDGGNGGAGIQVVGGATLVIDSAVTGGDGGAAGNAYIDGTVGDGGSGIVGQGLDIIVGSSGSVAGGRANGGAGARANAITFTGGTNILTFGAATSNLTGNIGVTGGGSLTLEQSGTDTVVDNVISGNGSLIKSGSAVITLAGANNYTGTTTVSDGTLAGGAAAAFSAASDFTVLGGSVLDLGGFDQTVASLSGAGLVTNNGGADAVLTVGGDNSSTVFSGSLEDGTTHSLGLTKVGTGVLTLSGGNLYTGPTTVSGGTLAGGAANSFSANSAFAVASGGMIDLGGFDQVIASLSGSGGVTNNGATDATLTVGDNASTTFGGSLADGGTNTLGLAKVGTGTLTLAGDNLYTGETTISDGVLAGGAAGAFSSASAFTVASGGVLDLGGVDQTIASLSGAGVVTNNGGADATLTVGGDNASTTFSGFLEDGATHALGLTKVGTGTLTLSGDNLYSGRTTISAGTLEIADDWAGSPDSDYRVNTGATLEIADDVSADVGSLADGTLGGGKVTIGATSDMTVLFVGETGATTTFSGQIGGAGSLEVVDGSLTLTGASAIGGDLTVGEDATVAIGGPSASFSTGVSRLAGTGVLGALDITGGADFDTDLLFVGGDLTADGTGTTVTVTDGPTFIGIANTAASLTISGGAIIESEGGAIIENPIVAAGAIVTGAGSTWNVATGLAVGNVMAGGTGLLTVSAGGAVNVTGDTLIAADTDWTGLGASSVLVTGRNSSLSTVGLEIGTHACGCGDLPGELSVADGGAVTATGPVKIGALGILNLGSGGTAGSFVAPSIQNDGRIVANFTDTATLGANVSGAGSLTKSGAGTLVLNGQNSFTGGTTVGLGKLVVGDAGHPGARLAGPVTVAAGGALGGAGTLTGNVTVDGTLAAGNSPGTLTFDGNLTLNAGSTSVFELNSPGVVGGSHPTSGNDLVVVNGNLKLGGTLQANVAAAGYYRLFNYRSMVPGSSFAGETITSSNGGFTVGSHELIYGVPNQVNLIVLGTGQTIQFWDGSRTSANGAADGGSGTWNVADTNWTDVAGATNRIWMRSVGVFAGTAGTVSVSGTQSFDTLQFSTDGYKLQGGTLSFGPAAGTSGTIQVDNNVTATINSVLANGATATGLSKTGGGTLVLSGSNQYTGGTSLLGGVLSVSSDTNLGRGGGIAFGGGTLATRASFETARAFTLATNGLIDVAGGTTLGLTGAIKGAGNLVKRGAGALSLTGANAYGDTIVEAGTLVGDASSISGSIGNAGKVVFDQADNGSFSGNITGLAGTKGTVVKDGAGRLVLKGTSTLDWAVAQGSLVTVADRFSGDVDIGRGGAFTFGQSGTASYAGTIAGRGAFGKAGDGTVVLTGDSAAFAGTTTVSDGGLIVGQGGSGALGGSLFVESGGMLGGTGTLGTAGSAVTIAAGGVHAPGNSIGSQTILGDYVNHGTLRIEGTPGAADKVIVGGKVDITGATLALLLSPTTADAWAPGKGPFTLIDNRGAEAVKGIFGAITGRPLFLSSTLDYAGGDGNDVTLKLDRNSRSFASVGRTPNQIATATALDRLPVDNTLWKAISLTSDENVARNAFDQLSGEIHASTATGLIEDSRQVRDAVNNRLRSAFEGVGAASLPVMAYGEGAQQPAAPATERFAAWGSAFGSWSHADSDGNAAPFSRSTGGFVTGADGFVSESWRLGIVTGYSHSSFKVDDRRSSASSDNYHIGLYGGAKWGSVTLRSGITYTWSDIESSRTVAFPGFSDALSASYSAGTTQIFGEVGYGLKAGAVAFEPFANLAYVNLHSDGFAETGGPAALAVESGTNDVTFTTLGLRASTDFALGSGKAKARGMLGWQHAFGDTVPLTTQAFAGSSAFTIAGAPIARDSLMIEAGFDFAVSPRATLGLSYNGQIASQAQDHGVRADLTVKF